MSPSITLRKWSKYSENGMINLFIFLVLMSLSVGWFWYILLRTAPTSIRLKKRFRPSRLGLDETTRLYEKQCSLQTRLTLLCCSLLRWQQLCHEKMWGAGSNARATYDLFISISFAFALCVSLLCKRKTKIVYYWEIKTFYICLNERATKSEW